jgi:hypothetical protein
MILKCKVELNNDLVTVINYNGNLVQIPSIKDKNAKFVNVWFNDGHYKVVPEDFVEPLKVVQTEETVKSEKKTKKKTTRRTNNEVV